LRNAYIPDILSTLDTSRYVSIIKSEGLEISQPALDPNKSEVHHQITAQGRRTKVHRYSSSLIVQYRREGVFYFFLKKNSSLLLLNCTKQFQTLSMADFSY